MFAIFADRLDLHAIARVVRAARRELDITIGGPISSESVEALAHQRLSRLADRATIRLGAR
jgi:hypothetical protein